MYTAHTVSTVSRQSAPRQALPGIDAGQGVGATAHPAASKPAWTLTASSAVIHAKPRSAGQPGCDTRRPATTNTAGAIGAERAALSVQTTREQGTQYPVLQYCRETLAMRRQTLGEQHPATAASYEQLGLMLSMRGEHTEARECCRQSLAILQSILGPEHPDTVRSRDILKTVRDNSLVFAAELWHDLGKSEKERGRDKQALGYHNMALLVWESMPDRLFIATAVSHRTVAEILQARGDTGAALAHYRDALDIARRLGHASAAEYQQSIDALTASPQCS